MSNFVPDSVKQFLARYINSVGQLELLLLARRTKERAWSADEAGRELQTSSQSAALQLRELAGHGFLECVADRYRYAAPEQLDAAVGEVERAYATYRTRIVSMIFA